MNWLVYKKLMFKHPVIHPKIVSSNGLAFDGAARSAHPPKTKKEKKPKGSEKAKTVNTHHASERERERIIKEKESINECPKINMLRWKIAASRPSWQRVRLLVCCRRWRRRCRSSLQSKRYTRAFLMLLIFNVDREKEKLFIATLCAHAEDHNERLARTTTKLTVFPTHSVRLVW